MHFLLIMMIYADENHNFNLLIKMKENWDNFADTIPVSQNIFLLAH
jgi:hypothetical protein